MDIILNGEDFKYDGVANIGALLDEVGAKKDHTALMLNGDVVPSEEWESTAINENDEIEMLVFVGGG